eukprot:1195010-Prorocentrum_minimum.AAC.16
MVNMPYAIVRLPSQITATMPPSLFLSQFAVRAQMVAPTRARVRCVAARAGNTGKRAGTMFYVKSPVVSLSARGCSSSRRSPLVVVRVAGGALTFKFKFTNKDSQNLYMRHVIDSYESNK